MLPDPPTPGRAAAFPAAPSAADPAHEDARDQAINAARERLARLAVLRVEEDQRLIDAQARAQRRHRLLIGASLLLLGGVAAALIWLLGNWAW